MIRAKQFELRMTFEIQGHIKTTAPTILTPSKVKGWLKSLIKDIMLQEKVQVPYGQIKGIIRYLDYQERDPRKLIMIAASPVMQLFGVSAKTCTYFNASGDLCKAILYLHQPARIHIIAEPERTVTLKYAQGVRDDVSKVVVENPHEVVIAKPLQPLTARVYITPLPFDTLEVPEWALPRWPADARTYLEAYEKIVKKVADYVKTVKVLPSPFGGRALHTVNVKIDVRETHIDIPEIPQDIATALRQYWRDLPYRVKAVARP